MLIKDALAFGAKELEDFPAKQLEARILLADILKMSSTTLLTSYNEPLTKDDESKFLKHIKRRKLFEPIAYITGKKEFYGLDFLINEHVLIPRPDTELLVDNAIREYENNYANNEIRVLDLGTGSGAIAISLAINIPLAQIVATDISEEALALATKNAELNNVASKIKFIKSDWYENISDEKFDFIISNPPYIADQDKVYMSPETLQYEPHQALFAQDNGLVHYKHIIAHANEFLANNGKIFLEIGFNQAKPVMSIFEKYAFKEIQILQDLGGNDRVVIGGR
jgi:release factor glutamine methyltransferase